MSYCEVIIVGAGLTGLSLGIREKKNSKDVLILEKTDNVGGLARTIDIDGFIFDIGPHVFRSKDKKILEFVKHLLLDYNYVMSNPAIFKYKTYFDPVIPCISRRNIEKLPENIRTKVIKELRYLSNREEVKTNANNFKSVIVQQIGETLYKEFFGDYSRKWWGIEPEFLSNELAPNNLKITDTPSYGHITTGFSRLKEEIYPTKGGIQVLANRLYQLYTSLGGMLEFNVEVIDLEIDGDVISKVIAVKKNSEDEIEYSAEKFIFTIPITNLAEFLGLKTKLMFRSLICIFVKVKTNEMITKNSWIYFHDPDIIFGRVHEPIYYSRYNAPKGFSSLCVEVTCFKEDKIWKNYEKVADVVVDQLLDIRLIKGQNEPEIIGITKIPYAYPIYTVNYKDELNKVINVLKEIKNLYVKGRCGEFKYMNMDGCIKWAVY